MSKTTLLQTLQLLLLLILLLLLANLWFSRAHQVQWQRPLRLAIYPVNADGEALTQAWIDQLRLEQFQDIERFFAREAARYRLPLAQPVRVQLAPQIEANPPRVSESASLLEAIWWSLKMQLWVLRNDPLPAGEVDARIFMNFHLPRSEVKGRHSLGLQRGLIGLVNGYAGVDHQGRNNLIAVHEFLHTLGASDKYNAATNEPLWHPDAAVSPDPSRNHGRQGAGIARLGTAAARSGARGDRCRHGDRDQLAGSAPQVASLTLAVQL
jgi:hypothetical protein